VGGVGGVGRVGSVGGVGDVGSVGGVGRVGGVGSVGVGIYGNCVGVWSPNPHLIIRLNSYLITRFYITQKFP